MGKPTYKLPIPMNDDSYNFSFSGLKSAVINLNHNLEQRNEQLNKEDLATSFQNVAITEIINKTRKAIKEETELGKEAKSFMDRGELVPDEVTEENIKTLIVAGGVAANQGLREEVTKLGKELGVDVTIPSMKYCTDNATMIAAAGYYAYKDGRIADLTLNSKSNDKLI